MDLLLNPRDWTPAAKKSSQRTLKDLSKRSQRLSVNDVATSFNLKEEIESDASVDEKEAFIEDDNKDEDEDDWEVGMVRRDPHWGKTDQAKSSPRKRGRPRKVVKQNNYDDEDEDNNDPDWDVCTKVIEKEVKETTGQEAKEMSVKKKRGRPKKNPEKEVNSQELKNTKDVKDTLTGLDYEDYQESDDDGYSDDEFEEKPKSKYKKQYYKSKKPQPQSCEECGKSFSGLTLEIIQTRLKDHQLDHKVEEFTCDCPEAPKLILNSLELPRLKYVIKYIRNIVSQVEIYS